MTDNVWSAGDALVLDSGTLHRGHARSSEATSPVAERNKSLIHLRQKCVQCLQGLANDSLGAPVPVLVLRYDPKDRPAPGKIPLVKHVETK